VIKGQLNAMNEAKENNKDTSFLEGAPYTIKKIRKEIESGLFDH